MNRGKWTLHHNWEDGITVELRHFHTKKEAEAFAKNAGYIDYYIDN